jgi:microcystin-dependent protein
MQRITSANNRNTLPGPLANVNAPGYFENNPGAGPGTVVDGDFLNGIQEEIAGTIEGAGVVLDKTNNAQLLAAIQALIVASKTAVIEAYAGAVTPTGALDCDGTLHNVADYPRLGARLGNRYGGDGVTTFGVPDLRGRLIVGYDPGSATGRVTAAGSGINSGVLGATGGTQNEAAPVSASGSTSGSHGVVVSGVTDNNNAAGNAGGGGTNFASDPHTHAFTGSGYTTGDLPVSVSGATATVTNMPPVIVEKFIIWT